MVIRALVVFIALVSITSQAQGDGSQERIQGVIFAGQTFAPWKMYIGNPNRWMQPTQDQNSATRSPRNVKLRTDDDFNGTPIVDVEFGGQTTGQLVWQTDETVNLKDISDAGGALSVVVKVSEAPTLPVVLRMDCSYPCSGTVNLTNILTSAPADQWVRVGISLSCFEDAGTLLHRVDSPFVLTTNGKMKMSIGDLRIVASMNESSLIDCVGKDD